MCLIRAAAALKQHKAKGPEQEVPLWLQLIPQRTDDPHHTDLCAQLCEPFWVSQHLFSIHVTFVTVVHVKAHIIIIVTIQFSWYHRSFSWFCFRFDLFTHFTGFMWAFHNILTKSNENSEMIYLQQRRNETAGSSCHLICMRRKVCSAVMSHEHVHTPTTHKYSTTLRARTLRFGFRQLRWGQGRGGRSFPPNRGQRSERDPVRKQSGRSTLSVWSGDKK